MADRPTRLTALTGLALLLLALPFAAPAGCDEKDEPNIQRVKLGGRTFRLEIAADDQTRLKGLGQRTSIAPDGGMLFVFRDPVVTGFVMRDCPIPIDIIYLDRTARIVSMYQMQAEPPRGPDEGKPGEINQKYEARLKSYPSRFPTQFVIELKGGTLPGLGLKEGDRVELPVEALTRLAR